jgi:hypothetical protein
VFCLLEVLFEGRLADDKLGRLLGNGEGEMELGGAVVNYAVTTPALNDKRERSTYLARE